MKVLAIDRNHDLLVQGLKNAGFEVEEDYHSSKQEIEKRIEEFDGLILRSRFPIDKIFLEKANSLKFIGRVGAGLENIDESFAAEKNIKLFNAPEGNRDAVAEHALGMLLMLLHRLRIADAEVRNGIWLREENRGDELMGKTVGIIGYGNMGKAFAKRLKGFGVRVVCYDILHDVGDENAKQIGLNEFFEEVDVVSLHTPQTKDSNGMVNQSFINSFNKQIYLINTARGKAVVTKDLVEGLKSGKLKGACLDVHEYEKTSFENLNWDEIPEDFKYLIGSDKVILAPHIAGWTHQSKEKLAQTILDKILVWKQKFS
ncbi:2-hydroxyacid dehydrogenase [Moheibacter lacus]|uniref:Hydroxyacid dehydrogenase n=1 Tax=Moheibacter lacus TaxID=2745851 RepID=A0A838ZPZ4_9FLAO|nr:2-hydroxyacid dehydrogenase [Moheibacter lacus]MBA5629025.1 hydroxyacid dehydrogenase [Moheibacter lacus]